MRAPVVLLVLPCALLVSAVIEIRVSPPRHGRLCFHRPQLTWTVGVQAIPNTRGQVFERFVSAAGCPKTLTLPFITGKVVHVQSYTPAITPSNTPQRSLFTTTVQTTGQ